MRFAVPTTIFILAQVVVLFSLAEASPNRPATRMVCTTASCTEKGTRTQHLGDRTITVIVPAPPCKVTTTITSTPPVSTSTLITASVSTDVVTAQQKTDTFIITSTELTETYPTTTETITSTPTTVTTITVPNPGDTVTTVTSYTVVGPKSTPGARRRGNEGSLMERGAGKRKNRTVHKGDQHPAWMGRSIFCSKEVTVSSTIKRPCHTQTSTVRARASTTTTTRTFVATVTQTQVPDDATILSTIYSTSTVTAPAATVQTSTTAPTVTVVSTSTAPLAITTVVAPGFVGCDPAGYQLYALAEGKVALLADSAEECCSLIAAMPGAINFAFRGGFCYGALTTDTGDSCPVPDRTQYLQYPGYGYTSGFLQCA